MSHERPEIQEWLTERGYAPEDIEKILLKLDELDFAANRDSIFDAMDKGELDIDALIDEALKGN